MGVYLPEFVVIEMTKTKQRICSECDVVMIDDWNLAPVGSGENNTKRIYQDNTYLCDGCYDHWCTKWNIQPLDAE